MAKKQRITGPGRILDRSAKKGKLKIAFDPSPNGFITEARLSNDRLIIRIEAQSSEIDPIEIEGSAKQWAIALEGARVPASRLADLEALITEEEDVHVTIEYSPTQDKLPGIEGGDQSEGG